MTYLASAFLWHQACKTRSSVHLVLLMLHQEKLAQEAGKLLKAPLSPPVEGGCCSEEEADNLKTDIRKTAIPYSWENCSKKIDGLFLNLQP